MVKKNSWPVIGTYSGEEISITFTATGVRDWIGHPDVPNGTQECESIEDVQLLSVEVFGKEYPVSSFPDWLQEVFLNQASEVEWEDAE